MDPTYPLVPFMNILSAVLLSLTLLTFALRRKANIGVVMLGVWLLIIAIWVGVDTIVWAKDARDVAPVWCKIWAHIAIAADVGGPACCTVINRRLHNILCSPQLKKPGKRERIRALAFDICLGVGLPLFMMALVSIIRPVKYVIQQQYGCSSTVPASALSIVLIAGWTVFFPALSILWYCPRIVWKLYRHTKQMNDLMDRSNIHRKSYFRWLAIGCFDSAIFFPTGVIYMLSDVKLLSTQFFPESSSNPNSWGGSYIEATQWRSNVWSFMSVTASMWTNSVLSLAFFTIFGLTADARATYHGAFFTVVRLLKRTKTTEAPPSDADSDVTELEKEVKNDTTVTVSFIDICASAPDAAMPTALKDGLEAEPKRVSRISAAEMDAARLSRSGDGVAVCGDGGVTLGDAVVVVVV